MDNNEKVYGTSVLDYIKEIDDQMANDDAIFTEDIMSESEVESERENLKSADTGSVSKVVSTDAISGIKGEKTDDADYEKISEIINERDIRGKTITNSGKEMIKDLLKSDATDDEIKHMSGCFDTWEKDSETIDDVSISDKEDALGLRITEKLKSITTEEDYESVLNRFAAQLYNTYVNVVQFNDDIKELNLLAKKVDDYSKSNDKDEQPNEITDIDKEFKNLQDIQSDILTFMEKFKNLDDRNSKLRQDFTLDDYDIRTVESVKECLDKALSFEKVYNKLSNSSKKIKKDLKNIKDVNRSIENWINDIKNDPTTLYTFPVNDFLTLEETRIQLTGFFYNTILIYNTITNEQKIPDNITDLKEYLLESGKLTKEDSDKYELQATMILYILSRTFKHKKLSNDNDRRILSYTLDMISKLGVKDHRDRFMKLVNYSYDLLYK